MKQFSDYSAPVQNSASPDPDATIIAAGQLAGL